MTRENSFEVRPMKQVVTILFAVILIALLIACSNEPASGDLQGQSANDPIVVQTSTTIPAPKVVESSPVAPVVIVESSPPGPTTVPEPEKSTEESDGKPTNFIGTMKVEPSTATVGDTIVVTGEDFPSNSEMNLVWSTVEGEWDIRGDYNEYFHGRVFTDKMVELTMIRTDSTGKFSYEFKVPDDFGFTHNITLETEDEIIGRTGFRIEPTVTIEPTSGPIGTVINITMKGVGYAYLENSWMLSYDNRFTGVLGSVTTQGTAKTTIPATGGPGKHILRVVHGAFTFPYMNGQQSPRPDRPTFEIEFTVTDGEPVMPIPLENQSLPIEMTKTLPIDTGTPSLWLDTLSGPIETPIKLEGNGFTPGEEVELLWYRVAGNRVSGAGWEEYSTSLGEFIPDADGEFLFEFSALDDLGGPHRIEAVVSDNLAAKTSFTITPSAKPLLVFSGEVGTTLTFNLKGVGWTETANIYHILYDNSYIGYACGFNTQGDVEIFLPLTGQPGWHYVDFIPGIYKGKDIGGLRNFRIPQLNFADDHPNETLPAFRYAVFVEP